MQPSYKPGQKIRFALMPFAFAIAGLTVYGVVLFLSRINGTSIKVLLQTDSLWPLVVFLPTFFFGIVLGFKICNFAAYTIPALRKIFDEEVTQTGRHDYRKSMNNLSKLLVILGAISLLGSFVFLKFG